MLTLQPKQLILPEFAPNPMLPNGKNFLNNLVITLFLLTLYKIITHG